MRGSASTPWSHAAVRSTTTACSGTTSSSDATRRRSESGTDVRDEHAPQHWTQQPSFDEASPQTRVHAGRGGFVQP